MKRKNARDEVPKLSKKERVIARSETTKQSHLLVLSLVSCVLGLAFLFSGCSGMTPDNFTFDTSNHQTNPQPLLGVDIEFNPQINVSNTNDNSSSADPVVTSTTSDTVTNTSTGGASTNTNTASMVK